MGSPHASHAWKGDRCTACGARASWPLAQQHCPDAAGGAGRRKLTDDDVRAAYARIQAGASTLKEEARRFNVIYTSLWRRAKRLGLPTIHPHTLGRDWSAVLARESELRAEGYSAEVAARKVGVSRTVLANKRKALGRSACV